MDQEKKPSEPVRLEVEVLIDDIDAIEKNKDDVPASEGRSIQDSVERLFDS